MSDTWVCQYRPMSRVKGPLAGVVGALVVVEATSGVLQGYYTPLLTDIARNLGINDASVNWFEAAQLLLSAIVVPVLARLGDMYGHRKVLIGSLIVTAAASWGLAFSGQFWLFTLLWAIQGFYVVWLPMNVSIIHARARKFPNAAELTAKGAGLIVVALEAGAIGGALLSGQLGSLFEGRLWLVLSVPALLVTIALAVVVFWVPDPHSASGGKIDSFGTALLSVSLLSLLGALSLVRVDGITWWVAGFALFGLALLAWFVKYELKQDDPLIDMRLIARPTIWPIILTSTLFGVSVLGAQGPLSTFVRTDPAEVGYGLGFDSATTSYIVGAYVFSLLVGALIYSRTSRLIQPRALLILAAALVAAGYLALPFLHGSWVSVVSCMVIAGLGSGALVAALPAAAAAAAPPTQTGVATGLTNTTKTLGGAFASAFFALALLQGIDASATTAASLSGYITVWVICGGTAVVAIAALITMPKEAFTHRDASAAGLDTDALALEAVGSDVVVSGLEGGPAADAGAGHEAPPETGEERDR